VKEGTDATQESALTFPCASLSLLLAVCRTLTVALDTAQYQLDMNHMARVKGAEDMYGTFNLLVRCARA